MKPSIKPMNNLTQQLQKLPQAEMPRDIFPFIQTGMKRHSLIKKHKLVTFASVAAVVLMSVMFFTQKQSSVDKDLQIQQLVKRTIQLEQLLLEETPIYSMPGSLITERIVNMESWLAKLDKDIAQTKDKRKVSELMAVKLDLLGDLVLLQRKINQKPDYQKIKPYII